MSGLVAEDTSAERLFPSLGILAMDIAIDGANQGVILCQYQVVGLVC